VRVNDRASLWQPLLTTAWIALAGLLSVAPYVYYLTMVAFADRLERRFPALGPAGLAQAELASAALVVLIAALTGALFARRYGLAGVGDRGALRRAAPWLALAPVVGVASYLLLGHALAQRVPQLYPTTLGWALARTLKGALFDEIVARFGMMTILCGIVRRKALANVAQATFFTALGVHGLSFFGTSPPLDALMVASVAATFGLHLGLGWLFARYGLWTCSLAHLLVGIEYPLHVLVGT
jgi:hypothetical protein